MDDEDDVALEAEVLEAAARAPEQRKRDDDEDEIDNLDNDRRCAICLSSPQRLSLRCSLLPCGHSSFCVSCIRQWLLKSRKSTCPLCLQSVTSFVDGRGTETEVAAAVEVGEEAAARRDGDDDDDEAAAARSLRNWVASSAPVDPYGGRDEDGPRIARRRAPASGGSYSRGVARLSAAEATRRAGVPPSGTAARSLPPEQIGQEEEEEEPGLQWRREIYRRGLERAGGRTSGGDGGGDGVDGGNVAASAASAAVAAPSAGLSTSTTPAPWAVAARVSLWCRRDLEALLGRGERDAADVAASVVEGLWRAHGLPGIVAAAAAAEGEEAGASAASASSGSGTVSFAAVAAGASAARSLAPFLQGAAGGGGSGRGGGGREGAKFWRELVSFVRSGLTVDAYDRTFRYRRGVTGGVGSDQRGPRGRGERGEGGRGGARETAAATSPASASRRSSNDRSRSSRSRSRSPPPRRRRAS